MRKARDGFIHAGSLEEIKAAGRVVVNGGHCPILVVYEGGEVHALDNRCPHVGFPLHRGTIEDGILTCHWHHARFDLRSGGTFDLWADDVPTSEVQVRDGEVWVAADCRLADEVEHWRRRLRDGMAHNIGLVIGKAVLGLGAAGAEDGELVREAALFGARHRDGWGTGMTILTALANLTPALSDDETYLALFQGIRRVAADCAGQAPRRDRLPLEGSGVPLETLQRWLRQWTLVRHRNGAERTLLTAISAGASPAELARLMLAAVTDRFFADGGHALDFINKSFECLDVIGWDLAPEILPTTVGQMVSAQGSEELDSWRHPVDLIALQEAAFADLPARLAEGLKWRGSFTAHGDLARALLGDAPGEIIEALDSAIAGGALPTDLGRALAYAAALRIARFGTSNEFSDWDTAHHSFTYCHALHQALKRASDGAGNGCWEGVRGVYHGAMTLYLNRYLNVPAARLPGEGGESLDDLPTDGDHLLDGLLEAFDRQHQVNAGARLVARYLDLGHPPQRLIATLAHALLREDAGFHTYQMFEAGIRQFEEWRGSAEARHILIAVTRYLAAHSPTERAQYQTATIARRLHRGGKVHDEDAGEREAAAS